MGLSRRQLLIGAGLAGAAGMTGLTACGGSGSGGGSDDGSAALTFTWWGNEVRNANTTEAIEAYTKANPGVTIEPQPGEWNSYWDRLATQTAGNTSPDIIQMDMAYISEYGDRGALLDLEEHGIDTSKFLPGTVDSGRIDGTLYGVNAGINTPILMANPELFEKAGMDMPDDTTWTWDDLMEIAAEVAKGADLDFGASSVFSADSMFSAFLRQNGKELFTPEGLGFEVADATAWFDMMMRFFEAGAIGTAAQISEESTKTLDQSTLAVGTGAMQVYWSNQVEAVNNASGKEMALLRFPSTTGKATDRKAWYKASMLWSVSSRTEEPEAAVALINWWMNSTESGMINLAERGIQPNTEVQAAIEGELSPAQQAVSKFISDIEPELAATPIAPLPGGGTLGAVMFRYQTEVLFGRTSTADAAQGFVDEVTSNLTV